MCTFKMAIKCILCVLLFFISGGSRPNRSASEHLRPNWVCSREWCIDQFRQQFRAEFWQCISIGGPEGPPGGKQLPFAGCLDRFDRDGDCDVDLRDWQLNLERLCYSEE